MRSALFNAAVIHPSLLLRIMVVRKKVEPADVLVDLIEVVGYVMSIKAIGKLEITSVVKSVGALRPR